MTEENIFLVRNYIRMRNKPIIPIETRDLSIYDVDTFEELYQADLKAGLESKDSEYIKSR